MGLLDEYKAYKGSQSDTTQTSRTTGLLDEYKAFKTQSSSRSYMDRNSSLRQYKPVLDSTKSLFSKMADSYSQGLDIQTKSNIDRIGDSTKDLVQFTKEDIKQAPKEGLKGLASGTMSALGSVGNLMQWAFETHSVNELEVTEKDNIATRMLDKFNKGVVALGKDVANYWNEKAQKLTTPELIQASWKERPFSKLASGVGQATPMYSAALIATALTKNPLYAGVLFGATEGSDTYVTAREKGKNPQEANILALLNGAWTAGSEALPFDALLGDAGKKAITRMAKGFFNEGLQEVTQNIGSNIIKKFGYDKGINIWEGFVDNLLVGGVMGAGGGALINQKNLDKLAPKQNQEQTQEQQVQEQTEPEVKPTETIPSLSEDINPLGAEFANLPLEQQQQIIEQQKQEALQKGDINASARAENLNNMVAMDMEAQQKQEAFEQEKVEKQEQKIDDSSIKDKIGTMNNLGLKIANDIDNKIIDIDSLTEEQQDAIYSVADGLAEDYVMKRIEGRVSMQEKQESSIDNLEKYIDDKINLLSKISKPKEAKQAVEQKEQSVTKEASLEEEARKYKTAESKFGTRYGDEIKTKVLELYKNGMSSTEISKLSGVSSARILDWAGKAGVKRTISQSKVLYEEDIPDVIELYKQGKNTREISEQLNLAPSSVARWISDAGLTRTPSEAQGAKAEDIEKAIEMYKNGISTIEIGKELGYSKGAVWRWVGKVGENRNLSQAKAIQAEEGRLNLRSIKSIVKTKSGEVRADSTYETVRIKQLDNDENVVEIKRAKKIPFGEKSYIPDLEITYVDGKKVIEEIKAEYKKTDENVIAKEKAAREYYKDKDIEYRIVTENDIGINAFSNIDVNDVNFMNEIDKARFEQALKSVKGILTTSQLTDIWNKANAKQEAKESQQPKEQEKGDSGDVVSKESNVKEEEGKKRRGFDISLEEANQPTTSDPFYDVISNKETVEKAKARIKESENSAIQFVLDENTDNSAEKTATAIGLIAKLNKDADSLKSSNMEESKAKLSQSIDIATKIAQDLTKAGQFIQAASLLSKLSPEGVLVWASKKINAINKTKAKNETKQELTTEQAELFKSMAKQLQDIGSISSKAKELTNLTDKVFKGESLSVDDLNSLKNIISEIQEKTGTKEEAVKPKSEKKQSQIAKILTERLSQAEKDARARIEARRNQKPITPKVRASKGGAVSLLPIQDIVDYSIIGASKIGKLGVKFSSWSVDMVEDLGDISKKDLLKIFRKSVDLFNEQKAKVRKINKRATSLKKLVDRAYESTGNEKFSAETIASMADQLKELSGDILVEKSQELAMAINSLQKATIGQKLSTIQAIGQLLNFKTNTRNIAGNELFWTLERLNKYPATLIDWTKSKLTGSDRTVTFASGGKGGYKDFMRDIVRGVNLGWRNINILDLDTKYDIKGNTFTSKYNPFTYLEKALGATLRGMDTAAANRAIQSVYGEMAELDIINNKRSFESKEKRQQWINNYIVNIDESVAEIASGYGKYVTFQDDTLLSKAFSKLKREVLNVGKDFGLGDFILKYPKTPANIIMRAMDYSPFGIIRGLYILKKGMNEGTSPRDAILALSRGVTGIGGLTALGMYIISKGIMTGDDDDYEVSKFKKEQTGEAPYQINYSMLKRWVFSGFKESSLKKQNNDTLISYDWAQPIAINFALSSALLKTVNNKKGFTNSAKDMVKFGGQAFLESFKVLEEQPLLQGLRDLFKGYGSISENLAKIAVSMPASFVPTFFNQVKQSISNEAKETWSNNPVQRSINLVINKLPFVSESLPQAYKTLGESIPREVYNSGKNTLWNVFFNPAFVAKYKVDEVTQLLLNPYNEEGRTNQFPKIADKTIKIKGIKYNLEAKDIQEMQRIMASDMAIQLKSLNTNALKNRTPEQQEAVLNNLVKRSSEISKRWFIQNRLNDYKKDKE